MATVELVASMSITYFSIWRNGKRKLGDSELISTFYWGRREDASSQEKGSDVTVAYSPILEWTE